VHWGRHPSRSPPPGSRRQLPCPSGLLPTPRIVWFNGHERNEVGFGAPAPRFKPQTGEAPLAGRRSPDEASNPVRGDRLEGWSPTRAGKIPTICVVRTAAQWPTTWWTLPPSREGSQCATHAPQGKGCLRYHRDGRHELCGGCGRAVAAMVCVGRAAIPMDLVNPVRLNDSALSTGATRADWDGLCGGKMPGPDWASNTRLVPPHRWWFRPQGPRAALNRLGAASRHLILISFIDAPRDHRVGGQCRHPSNRSNPARSHKVRLSPTRQA
jgi:hypothetical protein